MKLILFYIPLNPFKLPEPYTLTMFNLVKFHNEVMFYLVVIITFIFIMLLITVIEFSHEFNPREYGYASRVNHNRILEGLWVLIPTIIVITILLPSLTLLYEVNEPLKKPEMVVHILGNQWFWNYEYRASLSDFQEKFLIALRRHPETWFHARVSPGLRKTCISLLDVAMMNKISYDSYMITDEKINLAKNIRLYDTTTPLIIPIETSIRCLVTSNDVIHSWSVLPFGVKMDAIPGRLNQFFLYVNFQGVLYGQCSELCGLRHSFMPIHVWAIEKDYFFNEWLFTLIRRFHLKWAMRNIFNNDGIEMDWRNPAFIPCNKYIIKDINARIPVGEEFDIVTYLKNEKQKHYLNV